MPCVELVVSSTGSARVFIADLFCKKISLQYLILSALVDECSVLQSPFQCFITRTDIRKHPPPASQCPHSIKVPDLRK